MVENQPGLPDWLRLRSACDRRQRFVRNNRNPMSWHDDDTVADHYEQHDKQHDVDYSAMRRQLPLRLHRSRDARDMEGSIFNL